MVYVFAMLSIANSIATDWQTIASISTTLGVLVAILAVILTLILTLRSEKLTRDGQALERDQAEATAARSEAAAALTEEYTRRVVTALETMAINNGGAGRALSTTPPTANWSLTHQSGDGYLLTNVGEGGAEDVRVEAHESMILRPPALQSVEPGEAITFTAVRNWGTSDSTITVRWVESGSGELKTWKYPLPPRPPRK
jgi:hypothetical protein